MSKLEIQITALKSASDWQALKQSADMLSAEAENNPWANWQHAYLVKEIAYPDAEFWFLKISDSKQLIAVGFFRVESSQRKFGKIKYLRSLDWSAGHLPILIVKKDWETQTYNKFVESFDEISKATDTSILLASQQDYQTISAFHAALSDKNKTYKTQTLSFRQQIDLETWKNSRQMKKQLKNKRRLENKVTKELGNSCDFKRWRGDVLDELKQNGFWQQFKNLRQTSWQQDFQNGNTQSADQGWQYTSKAAKTWSKNNWLDICAYYIGSKLVAVYFNLIIDGYIWALQTYYNRDYTKYAVGVNNLLAILKDSLERGDKVFDFGGEAIEWKRRYSTSETPLYSISVPLSGVKATIWDYKQRFDTLLAKTSHNIRLHSVQNRNDFERAAQDKPSGDYQVRISCLKNEADWLNVRERLLEFEKHCQLNPWVNWEHWFTFWKTFAPNNKCWLIEIPQPSGRSKGLLAATILMEDFQHLRFGKVKILRSIDQMALVAPPFVFRTGNENEACFGMAQALSQLYQKSSCQLAHGLFSASAESISADCLSACQSLALLRAVIWISSLLIVFN